MYGFVDTVEKGVDAPLSIQTIFNGVNLDDELTDEKGMFRTLQVSGRENSTRRVHTFEIPHRDGVVEESSNVYEPKNPYVLFRISDKTNEGFRARMNRLNSLLKVGKSPLEFTDEPHYFEAVFHELEMPEEESNDLIGTIHFLCPDPHKYAKEEVSYDIAGGLTTLNNKGTANAKPILELTATKDTTFALIENQFDEYMLLGYPADDETEVVDDRTSIIYENGSTLSNWSNASESFVDIDRINKITGNITTDGAGIRANGYGTGDKLHGPAIYREIPNPLQDFEIESTFDIRSGRPAESWRMGINFLDENMNMLGHIGVKDNHKNYVRRTPLARYGPYRGTGVSNGNLIGDSRGLDNTPETTLFYLNVKRQGSLFKFYIGRWRNHKHVNVWSETFNDLNGDFLGRLKFISLYITTFSDRPTPNRLRINSIEVFELKQLTVDQTPYILRAGDELIIDHESEGVFINGINAMPLKHFGSDFFELPNGYSSINIHPDDAFEGTVRYRERYK